MAEEVIHIFKEFPESGFGYENRPQFLNIGGLKGIETKGNLTFPARAFEL